MILGHRALRLLLRRKFLGVLRKQGRRLRTPGGIALTLIGLAAIVLWLGGIVAQSLFRGDESVHDAPTSPAMARVIGSGIAMVSLVGALSFRGLYLPREEIELLFSAPLSRADVLRYRLWTSLGKSLLGASFLGLVVMYRMPVTLFGFLGVFVGMLTLPMASQIVSLYAGDAENRWVRRVPRGLLRTLNLVGVLGLVTLFYLPYRSQAVNADTDVLGIVQELLAHPVVQAISLPAWPWVAAATASDWAQFLPWFGLCVAIWAILFELCVRVPIDYRELSLETSADVARRLSRLRKGVGGAAAITTDADAAGWRVPWLFGRTPFGALAWRKTGTILRKARGTLTISAAVVLLLVVASILLIRGAPETRALASSIAIAVFGQIYLCAGLRFDFREDLERMDVVRSWPVPSWRVFLATILPEAVLVSTVLAFAILVRVAVEGVFPPAVLIVLAALGPSTLGWIAIDNAVFLVWPVRLTPGQEGLLQQAGRGMVLMLVRVLAVAFAAGVVAALAFLVFALARWADASFTTQVTVSALLGLSFLMAECALLIHVGGRLLARFDVARDR